MLSWLGRLFGRNPVETKEKSTGRKSSAILRLERGVIRAAVEHEQRSKAPDSSPYLANPAESNR
jgi:hypothetical protein